MIGKTAKFATSFKPVLEYCYYAVKENGSLDKTHVRGEFLSSAFLYTPLIDDPRVTGATDPYSDKPVEGKRLDIDEIASQYEEKAALNSRMQKPSWHQIFSFPIGTEPDQVTMRKIVNEFAQEFGLDDNQIISFIHRDKEHTHLHTVANRVNMDGVNNSKKFNNYIEVSRFCRKMEEKYNLAPDLPMRAAVVQDTYKEVTTSAADRLKVVIDEGISKYNSEKELIRHIEKKGYKVQVGRGISFVDKKSGDLFKGSDLGRDYSYKNLQIRLGKSAEEKHEISANITAQNVLRVHLLDATAQSNNRQEFFDYLREKHGIAVEEKTFEKDGKTYSKVDYRFTHQGKENLIPQSELGKDMTIERIESQFGRAIPQKDALQLRLFIGDNLDLHTSTRSLLEAVEKNTNYRPVIETYQGQQGQTKERLMFVHKANPKDRINSYDTHRQYTLHGLNTHYSRMEEKSFMQTVRDELNLAVPQSTSFEELTDKLRQKGLTLTVVTQKYGKEKQYNQRKLITIESTKDKNSKVEQKYLGKTYSYDALKKQLARNDDEQLRDRILIAVKTEAPSIRTLGELWAKLARQGIAVNERAERNPAGVAERHLTYTLSDKAGNPRTLDSARFGPLNPTSIQRKIDEQNRNRDKDDLRRAIDTGINRGMQPDQLARFIKSETDFDTRSSLRKIGNNTHTILTFSRTGQVKPISNNHLEVQYGTEQILHRCRQANPKGYEAYIKRIESNQLEYPLQINDRGITTTSTMSRDLLGLRDVSRSLPEFLNAITREGWYKWSFVDLSGGGRPELHNDMSGSRPIHGLSFGVEGQAPFYSGINLHKELTYPALNLHFRQHQTLSVSTGGGGDPKAKNTAAVEEQKPRILSTAAAVASGMEAQQDRIQADLDRQAAEINKQERDANAIERRDKSTGIGAGQGQSQEAKKGKKVIRKKRPQL